MLRLLFNELKYLIICVYSLLESASFLAFAIEQAAFKIWTQLCNRIIDVEIK